MNVSKHAIFLCTAIALTSSTIIAEGFEFVVMLEGEYAPELPLSGTYSSPGFAGPQAYSQIHAGGNDLTSGRVFCQGRLDYDGSANAARGQELLVFSHSSQFDIDQDNSAPLAVRVVEDMAATGRLEAASSVSIFLYGFFASDSLAPVVDATMHLTIETSSGSIVHETHWSMPDSDIHETVHLAETALLPAGDYRMRLRTEASAFDTGGVDLYANSSARFEFEDVLFGEARCPTDLAVDGQVDGADLGLFLSAFGTDSFAADFDNSGLVDGGDLGILLVAWGGVPVIRS